MKKSFPEVLCVRNGKDHRYKKKEVSLEAVDFNKNYYVYTDNPSDAFYVLNPRLMDSMLKKELLDYVIAIETFGDNLLVVFNNVDIIGGIKFGGPIIKFKEYIKRKREILKRLDLSTDLNDVISREIVDENSKRSVAKIK